MRPQPVDTKDTMDTMDTKSGQLEFAFVDFVPIVDFEPFVDSWTS